MDTSSDHRVRLSIIVPAYNNCADLARCLSTLHAELPPDSELIVVDDASTDASPSVAAAHGAQVLRLEKNSGPGAARNLGAAQASGEVLLFVDADVVVAAGALDHVLHAFAADPALAALFGSYDDDPEAPSLVSRYRNLLHHFVHQAGETEAATFWAGLGAVRRTVFFAVGGFDAARFPRPSIEDIELGYRLRRAGHRIRLDKDLQGKHLKRWRFWSMLRTDVMRRALPWSRLVLDTQARARGSQPARLAAALRRAERRRLWRASWPPLVAMAPGGERHRAERYRRAQPPFLRAPVAPRRMAAHRARLHAPRPLLRLQLGELRLRRAGAPDCGSPRPDARHGRARRDGRDRSRSGHAGGGHRRGARRAHRRLRAGPAAASARRAREERHRRRPRAHRELQGLPLRHGRPPLLHQGATRSRRSGTRCSASDFLRRPRLSRIYYNGRSSTTR